MAQRDFVVTVKEDGEGQPYRALAAALADWSAETTSKIYLFGSRVRGDHRTDSDVDVVIRFGEATDGDVEWWSAANAEGFASINARLPGPLRILENNDLLADRIVKGEPIHRDRNVACIWMPPKPS